jgi:3-isopropylmalate dehydrogenase
MKLSIAVLAGDGVGPEVTTQAVRVLKAVCTSHDVSFREGLIGGAALHATGEALPADTLALAKSSDAILLGAVGLPEFDTAPPARRPEAGLLGLRKALGLYANLRPARILPGLEEFSPLRPELIAGVDLIVFRELAGGLYYGTPRERTPDRAVNTMSYTRPEIERITRMAFKAAQIRRKKVTSVDKANVLECSGLWRAVVTEVAREFPDVMLEHALVDSCAMQLVTDPKRFDVLLTENMFGDILSDEASVLAGSIGMLPSASLGEGTALYEPVHGSAPDIAGQGKANPAGAIGSAAMLLRFSFGLEKEALAIEAALEKVLVSGVRTADLKGQATTQQVGDAVIAELARRFS